VRKNQAIKSILLVLKNLPTPPTTDPAMIPVLLEEPELTGATEAEGVSDADDAVALVTTLEGVSLVDVIGNNELEKVGDIMDDVLSTSELVVVNELNAVDEIDCMDEIVVNEAIVSEDDDKSLDDVDKEGSMVVDDGSKVGDADVVGGDGISDVGVGSADDEVVSVLVKVGSIVEKVVVVGDGVGSVVSVGSTELLKLVVSLKVVEALVFDVLLCLCVFVLDSVLLSVVEGSGTLVVVGFSDLVAVLVSLLLIESVVEVIASVVPVSDVMSAVLDSSVSVRLFDSDWL
jgi:hypothetical protein